MDCPSCSHRPFPAMLVNLETLHALTELHWSTVYELFAKTHRSSLSWPPLVSNSDMHNGKVAKDTQRDRLCLSFPSMSSVPSLFGYFPCSPTLCTSHDLQCLTFASAPRNFIDLITLIGSLHVLLEERLDISQHHWSQLITTLVPKHFRIRTHPAVGAFNSDNTNKDIQHHRLSRMYSDDLTLMSN